MGRSTSDTNSSKRILTRQTGISIGLLFLLVMPLISACVFIAVSNQRINTLQEINIALETHIKKIESKLDDHINCGINGLPHPAGIVSEIKRLKKQMGNRWTKEDDAYYMQQLARLNNLKLPEHKKISTNP